jgi:hypothetical protein
MITLQDMVTDRTRSQLHEVAPVVLEFASGPGALDAYVARCSCGLEMRNAFESEARRDAADHVDYWRGRGLRDRLAQSDRTRGWLA